MTERSLTEAQVHLFGSHQESRWLNDIQPLIDGESMHNMRRWIQEQQGRPVGTVDGEITDHGVAIKKETVVHHKANKTGDAGKTYNMPSAKTGKKVIKHEELTAYEIPPGFKLTSSKKFIRDNDPATLSKGQKFDGPPGWCKNAEGLYKFLE